MMKVDQILPDPTFLEREMPETDAFYVHLDQSVDILAELQASYFSEVILAAYIMIPA